MAYHSGKPRGIRDVVVDPATQPDWVSGLERLPQRGERVETHEGAGTVVAILGKTASAGRLLEVAMDDGRKHPFFAAAANVLVPRMPPAAETKQA